jgi:hypothetical protein
MNLIEMLQLINFVCLNDDTENDKLNREFYENSSENRNRFMTFALGRKGYVSLRTYKQKLIAEKTGNYDDFHLFAHFAMIDHLISYVALESKVELDVIISETLRCAEGKNAVIITELYKLKNKRSKQAEKLVA